MATQKESPAGAGQGLTGSFNTGKVTENQRNNQAFFDGTFESTKKVKSNVISTHLPGFAEAMRGTASPANFGGTLDTFPADYMPDDLKGVVDAVCKNRNADSAGAWASLFAVAGASLGKSCLGHFGTDTDWPALWWVLNGGPGTNKSPITKFFSSPLRHYEREAYDRYCADYAQWSSMPKKDRGDEPRLKSLIADGITDEQFFAKCYINGGAIFWARDEFDGLIGGLGQYNKTSSPAEANLKTMYSQEDVSRETVGGCPMLIPSPAVTILTTTQPDMLARIMRKYIDRGDGFFDRFLFVPMETQPPTMEEPPITDDVKLLWQSYVDRLLHNQLAHIYEDDEAKAVRLEARHKWQVQCVTHEGLAAQNDDTLLYRVASLYPKAHYTICRLAVVVARLRDEDAITAATMSYCEAVTDYLIHQQTKTLYSIAEAHIKPTITKKDVCRWLVENLEREDGTRPPKAEIARFMGMSRQSLNYFLNG